MPITATEALTELAVTIRVTAADHAYQPFTVSEVAARFHHRSRQWVAAQMKMHADGANLLPGVTLDRYPGQGGIYSVPFSSKES